MSEDDFSVHRVLIGIDASEHSLNALDVAAALSARWNAELCGLFIEDINLLRLAELPFARELSLPAGVHRPLEKEQIGAELRALAANSRQAVMSVAEHLQVSWSFHVQRGTVAAEVLRAAEEADLLILGWCSRPRRPRPRLGSTARAAVARAPSSVLLVPGTRTGQADQSRRLSQCPSIQVVIEREDRSLRVLSAAASLAAPGTVRLRLLLMPEWPGESAGLAKHATERLEGRGLHIEGSQVIKRSIGALCGMARALPDSLIVLDADNSLLASPGAPMEQESAALLDELACPILVVR